MSVSCRPSDLIASARCFNKILPRVDAIKSYLLCQWANKGGTPPVPPVDPLLAGLEYYPIDGNAPWYDATRKSATDYLHTSYAFEGWMDEFALSGGIVETLVPTFTDHTSFAVVALTPTGAATGQYNEITLFYPGYDYSVAVAGTVQANPADQLWYMYDYAALAPYYVIVPAATVAAGWAWEDLTWILLDSAEFMANVYPRLGQKRLWAYDTYNRQFPQAPVTLLPLLANGFDAGVNQAIESGVPGNRVLAHPAKWDYINNGTDPWEITAAFVVRPTDLVTTANQVCAEMRGINTQAFVLQGSFDGLSGNADWSVLMTGPQLDLNTFYNEGDWFLIVIRYDSLAVENRMDAYNINTGLNWSVTDAITALPWASVYAQDVFLECIRVMLCINGDNLYGAPWYGATDRAYLWNRCLSDTEVTDLYSLGLIWEPPYSP